MNRTSSPRKVLRRGSYLSPYARAAAFSVKENLKNTVLGFCAAGDAMFIQEMLKLYHPGDPWITVS